MGRMGRIVCQSEVRLFSYDACACPTGLCFSHTCFSFLVIDVLVVQESNKVCPDANQSGGTLTFSFDNPVLLSDIGLMDVDESGQRMKFTYADGVAETFTYAGFGDNAVQRVLASKFNVKKVEIIFPGSGAITEINFCPECMPQRKHDDDHHCLVAGKTIIKAEEQIAFDDFENSNKEPALKGWENGRVDDTEITRYTKFIGSNASGMDAPYKTFSVPREAETIIFDLDFYELESWDLGLDSRIFIDGEQIEWENELSSDVFSRDNEARLEGTTTNGVKWVCDSLGTLDDRKHHFTIEVPKASRLFDDGKLRLLLNAGVPGNQEDKTAGWDNVKVTARYGCAKGRSGPTPETKTQSCSNTPSTTVLSEDFEGENAHIGWSNFNLETNETKHFTKFLGRYGSTDSSPVKTFKVPANAQTLVLEVDFYEIDSWGKYDM